MATQGGGYDHPSYITHQMVHLGKTTAGASGVKRFSFPSAVRLRNASAVVETAGTSDTAGNLLIFKNGTTSIGQIQLGSSTAGVVGTSGDLNSALAAGSVFSITNGTDATGVASAAVELTIEPNGGTWSAP